MAKQSNFTFTNTTENPEGTISTVELEINESYSPQLEDPGVFEMDNKTCPLDANEIIEFRYKDIKKVNTKLNIQHPAPVKTGCQYQIQIEDTLRTTSTTDETFVVDDPIVAYLTIRHTKSGNITADHVSTVVKRLLSACMKTDGSWRFDDLMRNSVRPRQD